MPLTAFMVLSSRLSLARTMYCPSHQGMLPSPHQDQLVLTHLLALEGQSLQLLQCMAGAPCAVALHPEVNPSSLLGPPCAQNLLHVSAQALLCPCFDSKRCFDFSALTCLPSSAFVDPVSRTLGHPCLPTPCPLQQLLGSAPISARPLQYTLTSVHREGVSN